MSRLRELAPRLAVIALFLAGLFAYSQAQEGKAVGPNPPAGLFTVNGALKGNGSGTVSQAACADLSNGAAGCSASLPLSVANGGSGQASIPIFKVTLTSNQSITSSTWTKVAFGSVTFDSGSYWSTSNKNYVPLIAGTYMFCATIGGTGSFTLASQNVILTLSKNGLTAGGGTVTALAAIPAPTGTEAPSVGTCTTVAMNGSTDTIEADAFIVAISPNVVGDASFSSFFTGFRVSP